MKIEHTKPAIYDRCKEAFGVDWDKGVIITYGDTVYCKVELPDHLIAHEQTHIAQQQAYGVDKWWDRYFIDKEFRLSQEIEAYRNQAKFLKNNYRRQSRREIMRQIYKDMAKYYGGMCSEEEAEKLLNS